MNRGTGYRGFTLLELLLALGLLLLLSAAGVLSLMALQQGSALDEGAQRFQTMLIMARAEAANSGRTVRLAFAQPETARPGGANDAADTGTRSKAETVPAAGQNADAQDLTFLVLVEADPQANPGVFEVLRSASWPEMIPRELVRVEAMEITDAAAFGGLRLAQGESERQPAELYLTFFPDGASDSARVRLAARDPADTRKAVVRLDGITGAIRSQILTAGEFEREQEEKQKKFTEDKEGNQESLNESAGI